MSDPYEYNRLYEESVDNPDPHDLTLSDDFDNRSINSTNNTTENNFGTSGPSRAVSKRSIVSSSTNTKSSASSSGTSSKSKLKKFKQATLGVFCLGSSRST